ncbi:protein kinase domain-containing protein [Streptomyces sp. NBC_00075]|uniref:protein kinase domain-containing protein n=1 Tax=Streptomyces sp. NBC_00075 TaxID=2975641 RepID=UPI0038653091
MNGARRVIDGRFELLEQLGSGGMGTVWRARDTVLQRDVALKEVRFAGPSVAGAAPGDLDVQHERVLREGRALARLRHPNVVTIHHIVDQDPYPWLVMEFVPGLSLQDRLTTGPLDPREAARVGRDVLAALRTAHAAGVHHRDVKPANILLREGPEHTTTAVLTDFGIAGLPGVSRLTHTGEMVGSPEFMAPERIRGADDAPASDLWSLGMTLYVCVEGTSPMRRATSLATLAAVLGEPVPPPVHAGPLAPVLSRLLVADHQERPDAAELDALLAAAVDDAARLNAPAMLNPSAPRPTTPAQDEPSDSEADGLPPTARLEAPASRLFFRRATPVVGAAVAVAALIAAAAYLSLRSPEGGTVQAADGTGAVATVTATAVVPGASGTAAKSPATSPAPESEAGTTGRTAGTTGASDTSETSDASENPGAEEVAASPHDTDSPTSTPTSTATSTGSGEVVSSFALRGRQSGRCLTANLYSAAIRTCTGGSAQAWALGSDGTLKGIHGYLTATAGSYALKTTAEYTADGLQRWALDSSGEIRNEETGNCLNADGQEVADGTKVTLRDCTGETNQAWARTEQ